jgi:hypothetical protein
MTRPCLEVPRKSDIVKPAKPLHHGPRIGNKLQEEFLKIAGIALRRAVFAPEPDDVKKGGA